MKTTQPENNEECSILIPVSVWESFPERVREQFRWRMLRDEKTHLGKEPAARFFFDPSAHLEITLLMVAHAQKHNARVIY